MFLDLFLRNTKKILTLSIQKKMRKRLHRENELLSELFKFKLAKFLYKKELPREYLESFFIDLNQHKKIPQHILKDSLSLK